MLLSSGADPLLQDNVSCTCYEASLYYSLVQASILYKTCVLYITIGLWSSMRKVEYIIILLCIII